MLTNTLSRKILGEPKNDYDRKLLKTMIRGGERKFFSNPFDWNYIIIDIQFTHFYTTAILTKTMVDKNFTSSIHGINKLIYIAIIKLEIINPKEFSLFLTIGFQDINRFNIKTSDDQYCITNICIN